MVNLGIGKSLIVGQPRLNTISSYRISRDRKRIGIHSCSDTARALMSSGKLYGQLSGTKALLGEPEVDCLMEVFNPTSATSTRPPGLTITVPCNSNH